MSAADASPLIAALSAQPLFAGASADDLAAAARLFRRHRYGRDELVFARGDPGEYLILIEAGRIRLSVMAADGRELSLRIAGPGAIVGEIAVLDGGSRSADATALDAVSAQILSRGDFERLFETRPGFARGVVRMLCGRLRDTTDQLESIALYRIEARLARLFLGLLRQSHDLDTARSATLRLDINQTHLAEIVGASRPKVNRALIELEAAGAIRRNDGEILCRIEALTGIAEAEDGGL